jgi:organic hydroperoxide reductase OsmC/OhrA
VTFVAAAHASYYRGTVVWTGAAAGGTTDYESYSRACTFTVDGKPTLPLSADQLFRGDPAVLNPEELLLASLSVCHLLSWLAECALHGVVATAYTDDATATMAKANGRIRIVEVVLRPRAHITGGDVDLALRLHDRAHQLCFIANSVNFPVRHEPVVTVAE